MSDKTPKANRTSVADPDDGVNKKVKYKNCKNSNVSKFVHLFEIKRPNRSPYSTLEKTKSLTNLHKESSFSASSPSSSKDKNLKYKRSKSRNDSTSSNSSRMSYSDGSNKVNVNKILEEIEQTNHRLEEWNQKLKSKHKESHSKENKYTEGFYEENSKPMKELFPKNDKELDKFCNLGDVSQNTQNLQEKATGKQSLNKYKRYLEEGIYKNNKNTTTSDKEINAEEIEIDDNDYTTKEKCRLFTKNIDPGSINNSLSGTKTAKDIILAKREEKYPSGVKDIIKQYESFAEAENEGETEIYRRSLILEMDLEIEKMKQDGFIDDTGNITPEVTSENLFEILFRKDDAEEAGLNEDTVRYRTEILVDCHAEKGSKKETIPSESKDENEFGEILFGEDLEEGLYFLEAYNDDDRELIMVSMQVDRKSLSLCKTEDAMATQDPVYDMVFHQNEDQTLVLVNESQEESCASKHGSICFSDDANSSKRNTVYSTTSAESYDDRYECDEGISMDLRNDIYSNLTSARRETFCDDKGIVRIERIIFPETVNGTEEEPSEVKIVPLENKGKLNYIIDEIKSTERKYVDDLGKVVNDYMSYIEQNCPASLLGKPCYIFGNIDELYKKQRIFLGELENVGNDIKNVVHLFIDHEDLFQMYPQYFKNKPKSDVAVKEFATIIKDRQDQLNDRLDLSAYLLTPLQRLGKYKLFLENIHKQLEKEGKATTAITTALNIVKREMSKGNDVVAIDSIINSPIEKRDYGSFLRREKFNAIKPRKLELMVFLFENIIVFTTENQKNVETFTYLGSIKMNDLRIATFEDSTIHLTDYTRTKKKQSSKYTYILEAKSDRSKEIWRKEIEDILWQQLKKAKENTLKYYQNQKTRPKLFGSRRNRVKSTGSSTFYVND